MNQLLSWWNVGAALGVYAATLIFYRLFFHPLARIPGPRLAAVTRYYEAYWDVIQGGRYTFRIAEMHQKYGPIVRISPHELHINDPDFFDTLYRQDAHYDKYPWAVDAFAASGATLFTVEHHLHRSRRQPLGPFFAKARVASQEHMIRSHLEKLNHRLAAHAQEGTTFDLGAAITAFARDVANEYILGKSYKSLDREDFDVAMLAASQGSGAIWRLSKFIRWIAPTMQAIPISWILSSPVNKDVKGFFRHIKETQDETRFLMAQAAASEDPGARTIVHEIMQSKLSSPEKTFKRVFQDVSTVTGAGFETTATVLRLVFFHLFSDAAMLQRLRIELGAAGATPNHPLDWKALEQLPFLTAILTEGLRLSPGLATRMARIAPMTDLTYDRWRIPAGTPVGMTLILMHQDQTLYAEPRQFHPGRWLEGGALKKVERGFAPFSKGSRNCLGMYLAWAEMYILLADFAQRYDFDFEDASPRDFECASDQFAIGTTGRGVLKATVKHS